MTVIANTEPKPLPTLPLQDELTERQRKFINHPEVMSDPVKAAREAGYSDSYAVRDAWYLRKQLMYFIKETRGYMREWADFSPVETLQQLAAIASADILDYFDYVDTDTGARLQLKENIKALPAKMRAAIKKIEFETVVITTTGATVTVVSKLELHDKLSALKEFIEIHKLKDAPPADERTRRMLKGLNVKQLQRLEDTLSEIHEEVRVENRSKREQGAFDGTPD